MFEYIKKNTLKFFILASILLILLFLLLINGEDKTKDLSTNVKTEEVEVSKSKKTTNNKILSDILNNKANEEKNIKTVKNQNQPKQIKPKEKPKKVAKTFIVKEKDTLSTYFKKLKLSETSLANMLNDIPYKNILDNLSLGQTLTFVIKNKKLLGLNYKIDALNELNINYINNKFNAKLDTKKANILWKKVQISITDSLFKDALKAGVSEKTVMNMAKVLVYDLDFNRDLRRGDKFYLVYEEHKFDDKTIAEGDILALIYTSRKRTIKAFLHKHKSNEKAYYNDIGISLKKPFLRSPLKFEKISSKFSNGRYHPIYKKTRPHRGVDYVAKKGTKVYSTANGIVSFAGKMKGYGNVIFIKHSPIHTTVYAHLQKFHDKIKKGINVKQGQLIAYVGQTGLATGPHLHYEVRINGVHRDPLTIPLPFVAPIKKQERKDFYKNVQNIVNFLKSKQNALYSNNR